jgi:hypothetical protein
MMRLCIQVIRAFHDNAVRAIAISISIPTSIPVISDAYGSRPIAMMISR